jgi:hypothetical protein
MNPTPVDPAQEPLLSYKGTLPQVGHAVPRWGIHLVPRITQKKRPPIGGPLGSPLLGRLTELGVHRLGHSGRDLPSLVVRAVRLAEVTTELLGIDLQLEGQLLGRYVLASRGFDRLRCRLGWLHLSRLDGSGNLDDIGIFHFQTPFGLTIRSTPYWPLRYIVNLIIRALATNYDSWDAAFRTYIPTYYRHTSSRFRTGSTLTHAHGFNAGK